MRYWRPSISCHLILIFATLSPAAETLPYGKPPVTLNGINVDALTVEDQINPLIMGTRFGVS